MPFMVLCPSKVPFGQHITIERGPISFQLDVRVWGVATVVGGAKGCLAADTLHGKKTYSFGQRSLSQNSLPLDLQRLNRS